MTSAVISQTAKRKTRCYQTASSFPLSISYTYMATGFFCRCQRPQTESVTWSFSDN